jgi:LysR family glycine cleavage system transcriptional activator
LRAFEAAARHCNFRNAADELSVSHSAISHQVKFLEEFLQVELFVRRSRSVELTKTGHNYYLVLRDVFDRLADATNRIVVPRSANVLTLQVYSTFAIRWLLPRMGNLQKAHPDLQIRLITAQTDVDFDHDNIDLAVMIGEPSRSDLHYEFMYRSSVFPVCSPSLLSGLKPLNKPADLTCHTILQVHPSEKDWGIWLEENDVPGLDLESGVQFDSYDHALNAAADGIGIALAMQPFAARDLRSGVLVEPFDRRIKGSGDWYLVCRSERKQEPKINLFSEWLLTEIGNDPDTAELR